MLIVLLPDKFSKFVDYKYQIKYLKKKLNTKVEVHDLFSVVNKDWEKAFPGKRYGKVKVFKEFIEWKRYFKNKINNEKNLNVINLLSLDNYRSFLIHYELYKYEIKIIQLKSPEVCVENKSYTYSIYQKIFKFFQLFFTNFNRLKRLIKSKIIFRASSFLKMRELIILYSGQKKNILPHLNAQKTTYVSVHSSDYSNHLLLHSHKKKLKKKNFIVFLDTTTPYFTGDKMLFGYKINYNAKKWYEDLNNFLKKIEQSFNSRVIIIPHPRVRELKNPYYLKRFEVRKDIEASNKLIAYSKFVIALSPSTAISYCVINHKPINLIFNNQIIKNNPTMLEEMRFMSKILKTGLININKDFNKSTISLSVNKKMYKKYKFDYLTSKDINKKLNHEIINSILCK